MFMRSIRALALAGALAAVFEAGAAWERSGEPSTALAMRKAVDACLYDPWVENIGYRPAWLFRAESRAVSQAERDERPPSWPEIRGGAALAAVGP